MYLAGQIDYDQLELPSMPWNDLGPEVPQWNYQVPLETISCAPSPQRLLQPWWWGHWDKPPNDPQRAVKYYEFRRNPEKTPLWHHCSQFKSLPLEDLVLSLNLKMNMYVWCFYVLKNRSFNPLIPIFLYLWGFFTSYKADRQNWNNLLNKWSHLPATRQIMKTR